MGGDPGLSIPRLMVLMDAYEARRRRELGDLWRVIAHAHHSPEKPENALPPIPVRQDADGDVEPGAFDPVAMVRQQSRQDEEG